MKAKMKELLPQLEIEAKASESSFDSSYVRANIDLWKNYAEWRESEDSCIDIDALQQKRIDKIVRNLTIKFGKLMKAQPEDMLEAFAQFHEQATQRQVIFHVHRSSDEQEEDMNSEF